MSLFIVSHRIIAPVVVHSHTGALLLQHLCTVSGLVLTTRGSGTLLRHNTKELGSLLWAVVVVRPNVDQLLEPPTIGHGGHELE